MRKFTLATFLLTTALSVSAVLAQGKVLATVNGEAITEADVEVAMDDVASEYPNLPAEGIKGLTLDFLIEMKVVAQKAKAEKIDQTDEFKRRIAYVQQRVMMQQLLVREAKNAATDAAMKKFYDEQIGQIKPTEEVRARHILIEGEDDAKKALARVKGGEDFAKVAKELSKDPGSGAEGGDLGFFTKDRMVPEFAEAAFALKPGEVSGLVKSQFGYHIIKLEERRMKPVPTLEQVKDRLAQALAGKAQAEYLGKLRAEAKIVKTEETKKPEEPKKQ
ncbi:MAG: peptidylprolyl isomerase [Rhizobiales bacterium PAR1]|nr:MAG: peptidylprolyl isomerase [Rhizobiales bacterium PAR1]